MSILKPAQAFILASSLIIAGFADDAQAASGGRAASAGKANAGKSSTSGRNRAGSSKAGKIANKVGRRSALSRSLGSRSADHHIQGASLRSNYSYHSTTGYNNWFIYHSSGDSSSSSSEDSVLGNGGSMGGGGASGSWEMPDEEILRAKQKGLIKEAFFKCNPSKGEAWANFTHRCESADEATAVSKLYLNAGCGDAAGESVKLHLHRCAVRFEIE